MLTCKEIVEQADSLLSEELRWSRRMSIWMHLQLCRHCRRYVKQLRWLLQAIPTMHRALPEEELERVLSSIDSQ